MSVVTPSPITSMQAADQNQVKGRLRIDFLDGLRGLAALYVMLAHTLSITACIDNKIISSLSPVFIWATRGLYFQHQAVAVFIVLSGFCLMLPVARAKDRMLPGGLLGFAKRRARRILPPYYIALAFVLGIIFASRHFSKHGASGTTDLSSGDIISHFLLIHNLIEKYSMQIDVPMWSVAWEWQIYFLFALILLPLWRRCGIVWTVVAGCVMGLLPITLLPKPDNFNWTSPWYIGLFAFGMAAAVVMCSQEGHYRLVKNPVFRNIALSMIAVSVILIAFLRPEWMKNEDCWQTDLLIGAFVALFILACADPSKRFRLHTFVVKGLESRIMMTLGAFSYSLYLVHFPILVEMQQLVSRHHSSHYFQFFFLLIVGAPVCLAAAYLFHLAFERPFMPGRPKTERQAENAALVSPAP